MPDPELTWLCLNAFLAATLLPFPSEILLGVLVTRHAYPFAMLLFCATLGNVAGALFNWILGRSLLHYQNRHWFPFSPAALDRARARFSRHGSWWLLLAWLPIIGDPLTFAAGVLRIPLPLFLLLVTLGKGGRYLVLMLSMDTW
ncbi:MAG TPA: DedA family protein [Magnetococcales bacterium]|nr:DedA family protein [Magnetococcales bacterium]